MTGRTALCYIQQFLKSVDAVGTSSAFAVSVQKRTEQDWEDLRHLAELDPQRIVDPQAFLDAIGDKGRTRRVAKLEEEALGAFQDWVNKSGGAINALRNKVGDIKRILERQPGRVYAMKHDCFGISAGTMISRQSYNSSAMETLLEAKDFANNIIQYCLLELIPVCDQIQELTEADVADVLPQRLAQLQEKLAFFEPKKEEEEDSLCDSSPDGNATPPQ